MIVIQAKELDTHETPEYARAMRLEDELRNTLRGQHDWLMEYRKWLDAENIPAEIKGWPSEEAYDPANVGNFITYQLMLYQKFTSTQRRENEKD